MGQNGTRTSNVLRLKDFRVRSSHGHRRTVFYLNEQALEVHALSSFAFLNVVDIRSMEGLQASLCHQRPELIFLDSDIEWDCALSIANQLYSYEIPIVLFARCERSKQTEFVKAAYQAGISEVLFEPYSIDELEETLEVLLKFQHQVNSSL